MSHCWEVFRLFGEGWWWHWFLKAMACGIQRESSVVFDRCGEIVDPRCFYCEINLKEHNIYSLG